MLGKDFNRQDERDKVIFHQGMGIGAVYVDIEKRTKTKTLPHFASAKQLRVEALSEELRVLYVAMTRAKEKLVLTGCVDRLNTQLDKWRYAADLIEDMLPEHYLAKSKNYLDFLTPCLIKGIDKGGLFAVENARFDIRLHTSQSRSIVKREDERVSGLRFDALKDIEAGKNYSGREAEIAQTLWWAYPFADDQDLPSKVSISEIKRIYYSEMTGESDTIRKPQPVFNPPDFLSKSKEESSMYRGTAIHTVIEHMDLERHTNESSVRTLVNGLIAGNILPADAKHLIPIKKIVRYAQSPLADRIRKSPDVKRETPFVLGMPAKDIYSKTSSEQTILVHGIIDCWFVENGNNVLVDFKSDSIPRGGLEELISRYRIQMKIYAEAIERTSGKLPAEILLYLFSINDVIRVDI
jgi:ATP-dependent helicase/nuclease subunit A